MSSLDPTLLVHARLCVEAADAKGERFAFVESCTGGLIGAAIAAIPGASRVFDGSIVPYSNESKTRLVGSNEVFMEHGSVSEEAAAIMAHHFLQQSGVDHVISSTGIAGPAGGTDAKPVGLVHVAAASRSGYRTTLRLNFDPHWNRNAIVQGCALAVLGNLQELIETGGITR